MDNETTLKNVNKTSKSWQFKKGNYGGPGRSKDPSYIHELNEAIHEIEKEKKKFECAVCGYRSDNAEDFNDSSPGRALCKMRGQWDCVRDFYKIRFMKESGPLAGKIEGELGPVIKKIKTAAKIDRITK